MSIEEIIVLSDNMTIPPMGVGCIVKPKVYPPPSPMRPVTFDGAGNPVTSLPSPPPPQPSLDSPSTALTNPRHYAIAIVVSMNPFILVSEKADMRWETTINQADFEVVGVANPAAVALCNTRLAG